MDLNVLRKKPRMPSRKSAPAARPGSTQPEVEVIHMETSAKRPVGMRKHKSRHGEGSSRRATRGKESEVFAEDSSPTYRRPKSMKDLCGMRVHEDDEGYYVLQMADWAPRDSSAAMQVRWPNLSYQAKVWDDSEAASEFGRGVLHPTLAKNLYTLPSEFLIDRAAKQIALMALLDRVHDSGRLVTHMGNRASLLEAEIEKLKMEGDPEQLTIARQGMKEQRADRQKANDELLKLMRENEFLKVELPSKSVANYKQSESARALFAGWPVASALPCRLLLGALFTGRPDTSALRCRQPPAIRGTVRWSARHVCSTMLLAAYCQGDCSLAAGFPIGPPRLGRAPGACPTWLNRDVAEVGEWCSLPRSGPTTIGPIIKGEAFM
ncbi:hypothetical protein BHM03_00013234 [Ensete ventricosum]|nr:hypothetical protein BHM03_00013234 [Ensete ventricosum]